MTNEEIDARELQVWAEKPAWFVAYFVFPAGGGCRYRATFYPTLVTAITKPASVQTWLGAHLGRITFARVYRHNFGGRMVSLRVQGTNGEIYYGRASWDNGTCVNLRKAKQHG